ncbi:MAG: hypothetical protein M0R38_13050 [Bacteroidia bacterium]|nr:hypothetical protein [Bacteroidia bacterium]
MIKVSKIKVMNLEGSFRGMRNPLESWEQSDSYFYSDDSLANYHCEYREGYEVKIKEKDMALAQKLLLAGDDHSKFMRQIFVSMDITAPLYFFKEFDTYKVGTTANSTSTMHKLAVTPITRECFSFDNELEFLEDIQQYIDDESAYLTFSETAIRNCNTLRLKYLETKDIRYWRALIQLLPSSWNQTRTWTANYQVLRNIYFARKNHKLQEWKDFCEEIEKLPYAKELFFEGESKEMTKEQIESALGYRIKIV